jgi:HTH-type transcriptional regulator/antitoxin HigA
MKPKRAMLMVPHPGEYIEEELKARGWTQRQLSVKSGLDPTTISQVVRGRRDVSLRIALALSKAFGTSPEFWMNLQTRYSLRRIVTIGRK